MFNVIATPGDVFSEVRSSPSCIRNWLVPGCALVIVSWICAAVILSQPSFRHQLSEMTDRLALQQKRLLEKRHVPKDRIESVQPAMEKWMNFTTRAGKFAAPVLLAFGWPFIWAMVIWLIGSKIWKAQFPFMKAAEAAGLVGVILTLDSVVTTLLVFGTGNVFANPSLALVIKDFDPLNSKHQILAAVNLMTLWGLAARSIALARLSGASTWKSAAVLFGLWALWTGGQLGMAVGTQAALDAVSS
jgi:hypothetical protein